MKSSKVCVTNMKDCMDEVTVIPVVVGLISVSLLAIRFVRK